LQRPVAVAITGGIGAGKSEALAAFARHCAAVISSDDIVHRLLAEDEDVKRATIDRLGEGILDDAGQIDRKAVAEIVFADRDALEWLESLLHPRVVHEYLAWRDALGRMDDPPAVVATEVPLLYEAGGESRFDVVVAITAPSDVRDLRARVPLAAREPRLLPEEEKVKRADFAYVNDGSPADLDAFVARVMDELVRRSE